MTFMCENGDIGRCETSGLEINMGASEGQVCWDHIIRDAMQYHEDRRLHWWQFVRDSSAITLLPIGESSDHLCPHMSIIPCS
jgi:hypothetical protein